MTAEVIERMRSARAAGLSWAEISAQFHVGPYTAARLVGRASRVLHFTEEQVALMRSMRTSGKTWVAIATEFKVSKQTVRRRVLGKESDRGKSAA